jgi:ElaB/YqjD/DUF883 family membrane-anchored ribosome-binding protein
MERRKNRMTNGVRSVKERVMGVAETGAHELKGSASHAVGTVHDLPERLVERTQGSPLAAGAIAAGVGFLAAALIPPSRKEQQVARELAERAEPVTRELAAAAKETAEHLREPAKAALDEVRSAATDAAHQVSSSASDAATATTDQATR